MYTSLAGRLEAREWLIAGGLAALLGIAVALQPLLALVVIVVAVLGAALSLAGISVTAGAIGGVVLGHLVSGQFYVTGVLPEGFAALLDLTLATLLVSVALRPHPRSPRSHVVTVVFLALASLSVLNPLVPSLEYGVYGLRQLVLPLAALLVAKEAELSRRDLAFILAMLAAGWLFNVGVALRQWLVGFTALEEAWIEAGESTYLVGDQIRLMGATQSSQDFAFLAAVAAPTVTAYFFAARRGALRTALGVLVLLSFAVLFGSLIRSTLAGGVIGALVAALLVSSVSDQPGRLFAYGVTLVGVLAVLALVAPGTLLPENKAETLFSRAATLFDPASDRSFRERRSEVWPRVLEIVRKHPLGGGPGSAGPLSQVRPSEAPFGSVIPDNGYLLMAVQLGLLGPLLFIGMLLTWLRDLVGWVRRGVPAAAAAGAGAVVALMIGMTALSLWSLVNASVVFGVVVGLGLRGDGRRGRLDAGPEDAPETEISPEESEPDRHLLVVAAPLRAADAVHAYLEEMVPELERRGWSVGLLWGGSRTMKPPSASWSRRLPGRVSLAGDNSKLQNAIVTAVGELGPDLLVSMTPQSDLACSAVRAEVATPWVALLHRRPWSRKGRTPPAKRLAWRSAVGAAYRRADAVLAESDLLAQAVRSGLALREPVSVVGPRDAGRLVAALEGPLSRELS
jgi:hypothetical protein